MSSRRISLFIAALVFAIPQFAAAAPTALPFDVSPGFGSTSWELLNTNGTDSGAPFFGTCNDSPGFGIDDATSPGDDGDAYDNALSVYIDGNIFVENDGTVDLTGTTVTTDPVSMSGLNVSVQYYFPPTAGVARMLVFMQNPGPSAITATVQIPINYGSDGITTLEGTSSGDTTLTVADRWLVTSQGSTGEYNTTVWYGPGAAVTPDAYTETVFDCADPQGVGATFTVEVPAGSTRSLMTFHGLGAINDTTDSLAGALAAAPLFDTLASVEAQGWLAGLTPQQIGEIVNWSATPAIPTLSEWAMILLALGLAGAAFAALRRRGNTRGNTAVA